MVILTGFEISKKNSGSSHMNFNISVKSETNYRVICYNAIQGNNDTTTFGNANDNKMVRAISSGVGFTHIFGAYEGTVNYPQIEGWTGGGEFHLF